MISIFESIKSNQSHFFISTHHALRAGLHNDIRFKIPGSIEWDSFASRHGIPLDFKKRMIYRTTIHSEEEALLVGDIPKGEYGGGNLEEWDSGPCEIIKYDPSRHIEIVFHGKRIQGLYHMMKVEDSKYGKNAYLFFKGKEK